MIVAKHASSMSLAPCEFPAQRVSALWVALVATGRPGTFVCAATFGCPDRTNATSIRRGPADRVQTGQWKQGSGVMRADSLINPQSGLAKRQCPSAGADLGEASKASMPVSGSPAWKYPVNKGRVARRKSPSAGFVSLVWRRADAANRPTASFARQPEEHGPAWLCPSWAEAKVDHPQAGGCWLTAAISHRPVPAGKALLLQGGRSRRCATGRASAGICGLFEQGIAARLVQSDGTQRCRRVNHRIGRAGRAISAGPSARHDSAGLLVFSWGADHSATRQ